MAYDLKYGEVEIPGIDGDEPVFIIRAKDIVSTDTIRMYWAAYLSACSRERRPADANFVIGLDNVKDMFERWQDENSEKLKLPD